MSVVYVIRHGDYRQDDPEQGLSRKGIEDIRQIASQLKDRGAAAAEIWHSPKKRAAESACIIQAVLGVSALKEKEGLVPDADPEPVLAELGARDGNCILVSHLPLIPRMVSVMFPTREIASSEFPTASAVILERESSGWVLREILKSVKADHV